MRHRILLASLALPVCFATAPAGAVDVTRFMVRGAVEVCQGSLPSFEGKLRKRPLAIANEGDGTAFLGCSLEANELFDYERIYIGAIFVNRGTMQATVNCTLVDGLLNRITPVYYAKSASIVAGEEAVIAWTTSTNADGFGYPSLICALPPGVEIGWISDRYPEDVGA